MEAIPAIGDLEVIPLRPVLRCSLFDPHVFRALQLHDLNGQ